MTIHKVRESLQTLIDELTEMEVDASSDMLSQLCDDMMTGDRSDDARIETIIDGIRWAFRASVTVDLAGGALLQAVLPDGVRITHEWADARTAEPALNAAFAAIAAARRNRSDAG